MGRKKGPSPQQQSQDVYNRAVQMQQQTQGQSQLEQQFAPVREQFMNQYNQASQRQMQDYGDIMGGYGSFMKDFRPSFERVSSQRPQELGESYGYLREAMPGYREFASTGGYSPTDIQELRARGVNPIRAAYGNTMMELDRARALGGAGGAPNYIAALSRAQRELPEQLATATTDVNAQLADAIRKGRMFGLGGISETSATMGGLSSQEAGRMLQAALSNQQAGLETQRLGLQGKLGALGGMTSLYGTTPAMASTFGNQALNAWQQQAGMESQRQGRGMDLLDQQLRATQMQQATRGIPWWQKALGIAGTVAPFFGSTGGGTPKPKKGTSKWGGLGAVLGGIGAIAPFFSDINLKEDIRPVKSVSEGLKKLPIYTWKYKGENTRHLGPMAQHFKKVFGIGDGKTIAPVDAIGIVLASQKEALENA